MQILTHPRSGMTIEGVRLPPGSVIRKGDRYDSTSGEWETGDQAEGLTIQSRCDTIWVRQSGSLSVEARTLLGYLNSEPWGAETCIAERDNALYVIPSPEFNWDGRFDIEAMRVVHPECVQELVDHGYLSFGEKDATGCVSDYASVRIGHRNRVCVLTNEGKETSES